MANCKSMGLSWRALDTSSDTPPKKTHFPSPGRVNCRDSRLGLGLCPSLLLSAGVLCTLPQSLGIHLEDTASLKSSMTSGSCNLFPFLPYSSPSLRGWGFDEGIPCRPECSKVSHSLLCVNYHLLQEASLVRAE